MKRRAMGLQSQASPEPLTRPPRRERGAQGCSHFWIKLLTPLTRAISPTWIFFSLFTEQMSSRNILTKPQGNWEGRGVLTYSAISPKPMFRESSPPTSHLVSFQAGKVQGDLVTHSQRKANPASRTRKREQGFW